MDINELAESIVLCKEEQDFYKWLQASGNTQIHFGDPIKLKNVLMYVVGGTESGHLYCQKFEKSVPKSKRRFDPERSKVILYWRSFLFYKTKEK